jgi:hypothetical protein
MIINSLLDFVDVDAAIEYVIRSDGYGQVLNGYDGTVDSYTDQRRGILCNEI